VGAARVNLSTLLGLCGGRREPVSRVETPLLVPDFSAVPNAPGRSGTYSETNGTFASSIDPSLTHLTSAVTYDLGAAAAAGSAGLPPLILAHGYSQDMGFITQAVMREAARMGFVAMAVNLRGRGGDDGTPDDSCRELIDFIDALDEAKARLGPVVDRSRPFGDGFSGGGGNMLGVAVKCPGMYVAIASHFFGADYGFSSVPGHSYWASGDNPAEVIARIGPRSDLQPYRARLHTTNIAQAMTQTSTKLFLAHDSEDLIGLPNRDVRRALLDAGAPRSRWWFGESNPRDDVRWEHGYPSSVPDLYLTLNALGHLRNAPAATALQMSGTYTVTGFVIHAAGFEVWTANTGIADPKMHATGGQRHCVDVAYDVGARHFQVSRRPQAGYDGNCAVQIRMGGSVVTQDVTSDGVVFNIP
jgi:hypothetical protein